MIKNHIFVLKDCCFFKLKFQGAF
uniref:Uncharacterized protein n=1 Tax=Anguilla anguilla TaxID=7936 RepID=A0A0E9UA26_ANGAN